MRLKPWMIWTVVVICLLSVSVGITLMLIADFHNAREGGLMRTGVLMVALPFVFVLGWAQHVRLGRENLKLVSGKGRLVIWGLVVLLVFGTVLIVVWVLGLERQ